MARDCLIRLGKSGQQEVKSGEQEGGLVYCMEMCFNAFSDDFAGKPALILGPLRTAPRFCECCSF